jgi:four helix bundle protein
MDSLRGIVRRMATATCQSYKDLEVWGKAIELAVEVHGLTSRLPRHELFGLTSQMRRAAVSIPSNVAEGACRRTTRDFVAFLHVARGSVAELETQWLLALRIGYIDDQTHDALATRLIEIGRLLNGLIRALQKRLATHPGRR